MILQKELYYAELDPAKGSEQKGLRPVLVISGNSMNEFTSMCIVCPLTTQIKGYSGALLVKKNNQNNLKKDSEVLTFQIRTISKERLIKRLGEVNEIQFQQVIELLNKVLKY